MTLCHVPHLFLISSSPMKLRCEYYLYIFYLLNTNIYLGYNLRSAANRIQEVMSPGNSNSTMSAFSTNNPDTTTLVVPKLRDDGSNWADYEPRIQRVCQVWEIYGGNSGNSGRQVRTYKMSEGTSASAYVLHPFQTLVPRFRNREIRDRRPEDWSKYWSCSRSRN